jgi:hypothetical protein
MGLQQMPSTRSKAFAFSALLVLVSGAFVATAVASTSSALAPLRRGDDYALERSLSRHGVTLGVIVGAIADGKPGPAVGADVTLTPAAGGGSRVAQKEADENGHAVLRVPRGAYTLTVAYAGYEASREVALREDQRMVVYFDEAGTAYWQDVAHRQLERQGETKALLVRLGARSADGNTTPVEGATVRVYRVLPDGDRAPTDEFTQEKQTGPRGAAVFQLHQGAYDVEVSWRNETGTQRVALRQDARAFFLADETGIHSVETGRTAARRAPGG